MLHFQYARRSTQQRLRCITLRLRKSLSRNACITSKAERAIGVDRDDPEEYVPALGMLGITKIKKWLGEGAGSCAFSLGMSILQSFQRVEDAGIFDASCSKRMQKALSWGEKDVEECMG